MRVGWVERRVLIGPVAERILQIVVHSDSGANDGLAANGAPGQADSWLRQEPRVIGGEEPAPDLRLRVDHSIRERII